MKERAMIINLVFGAQAQAEITAHRAAITQYFRGKHLDVSHRQLFGFEQRPCDRGVGRLRYIAERVVD
jgi:hypothetical protein